MKNFAGALNKIFVIGPCLLPRRERERERDSFLRILSVVTISFFQADFHLLSRSKLFLFLVLSGRKRFALAVIFLPILV